MKKVMLYARHGKYLGFSDVPVKTYGHIILFFSVFVCGTLTGCCLYKDSVCGNFLETAAGVVLQLPAGKQFAICFFCSVIVIMTVIVGSLSCFGIGLMFPVPFFTGFVYAVFAMYLLLKAHAHGLGYFSLVVLPGGVLWTITIIIYCAAGCMLSNQMAQMLLFGKSEDIRIKGNMAIPLKCAAGLLLSAGINVLLNKIFAGLY